MSSSSTATQAHRAAVISNFRSHRQDTSLHCKTTNSRLVHREVCLFVKFLSSFYCLLHSARGTFGIG